MIDIVSILSVYISDDPVRLRKAIQSIESQSHKNWHLLIGVDGPVSQEIRQLLHQYSENENITVINFLHNRGLAHVLNDLISFVQSDPLLSQAPYVSRMDADDVCLENRFECMLNFMNERTDIDVAGSNSYDVNEHGEILYEKKMPESQKEVYHYMFLRSPLIHPSVFFRSKVFFNHDIRYPTDSFLTEDLMLWSLLLKNGYNISNLPRPLIYFTVSSDTYTRRNQLPKALSEFKARYLLWKNIDSGKVKYMCLMCIAFSFKLLPIYLVRKINKLFKSSR